jgi:hypothetical protein
MDARRESEPTAMKNHTTAERKSERELVVTRTISGPARTVFEAWTKPELFKQWWYRSPSACPCFPARWTFVSGQVLSRVQPPCCPEAHGVLR